MANASDPNVPDPLVPPGQAARNGSADTGNGVRGAVPDGEGKEAGVGERAACKGVEVVDAARRQATAFAEEGKDAGAERLSGVAHAFWTAADDLEGSSPDIARHVRSAAEAIDGISGAMHERSAGQLMHDVSDFARRQPAAFFGVAAIAGFALVRFARSSPDRSTTPGHREGGTADMPETRAATTRPPMTTAQATLRGAAAREHGSGAAGPIPTGAGGGNDAALRSDDDRVQRMPRDNPGARP
jgi:hypothetical protein